MFPHIARRIRGHLALVLLMASGVAPRSPARLVEITILQTTDLHGHLVSTEDYDGRRDVGGLLRCASAIEEVRSRDANVLLVDGGDLVQGAAESWLTAGSVMTKALGLLRYDAWVLGNHDFDWGSEAASKLVRESPVPVLAANLRGPGVPGADWPVRPFLIRDVDGVRVALVGLTSPGVPQWLRPEMLGGLVFESSMDALTRVLPAVRAEDPDVLVLLAHQGYQPGGEDPANEIGLIANRFPELDVILGGHVHEVIPRARLNGVLYAQGGYHGHSLTRVRLVYDTVRDQLVSSSAEAMDIADRYLPSATLAGACCEEIDEARAYLDGVIGSTEKPIGAVGKTPGQSGTQQLIAAAIAAKTGAEVVLHGILTEESVAAGAITLGDVWRIVPYENRVGVMMLTAGELKTILEENVRQAGGLHFMGVHGLKYDLCRSCGDGARVQDLRLPDGTRIHPKRRLKVAASSYALASGGGRFPALRRIAEEPTSRLELTAVDTRSAVIEYVKKNSPLRIEENSLVGIVKRAESDQP